MTTLILFLPPHSRLHAAPNLPAADAGEYAFLLTADGKTPTRQGSSPAALLPRADTVIAIPDDTDISWQRLALPRAGRQMRAALAGLLEEQLLDDPEGLHFAIEPDAAGGDTAWVAITSRARLTQQLAALEAAQLTVDRIAPLSLPQAEPSGYFHAMGNDQNDLALRWSHADGVASLPLAGSLTRQLLTPALSAAASWTASPAAAARAEQWLGAPVTVVTAEQRALGVLDTRWDLRQFELAQRTRGTRALRQGWRALMQRRWRPVRIGLAALVAVQLLGLNLLAWRQHQQLQNQQAALARTLTDNYPQVRAVLDAPLQMQRETELLRASAGRAGPQDLEALLAAAASAWPADRGPVDAVSFEPGRLVVSASGWSEAQIAQFRGRLQSDGWQLDAAEGRLTLSRATAKPTPGVTS
jgi:general secretion pathway protein L